MRNFFQALRAGVVVVAFSPLGCLESPETGDEQEDDEVVGEASSELLNIGAAINVTPSVNANQGNEAVATAVSAGGSNRVVVASFNSKFGFDLPDGYRTHCGWAKSNTTFTSFTSYDSYYTPLPTPSMSSGSPYGRCRGDTWVTAVGPQRPNQVVMTAVADAMSGSRDAILWSSTNGGTSFSNVVTLSSGVSAGMVDGPKVASDPTNSSVYVWWWNTGQHFLRKATVATNGTMTLGPLKTLTNKVAGTAAPLHATLTIKPAASAGGRPRLFLAYPTAGMTGLTCTSNVSQTLTVNWYLAYSDNDGDTWTSHLVDSDPAWPGCQFTSPPGTSLGGNRSYISSSYDPVSDRVLLAYQKHVEDAAFQYVGTRVITAQWPHDPGGTNFEYWTPVCNSAICPPPGNCLVDGRLPIGETYCTQFGQSIGSRAVGGSSRMAVVWHDTRDTPLTHPHPPVGDATSRPIVKSNIWGHSIRPGEPFDCPPANPCPKTQSRITPLSSSVPWLPTATNGNLWWGDYEHTVVDVGGKFFTVWADNRDQTTTTRLKGASFNEGEAP